MPAKRTAIVTGAAQGIGAGLVEAFLKEDYNVVGTSVDVSQSLRASANLVLLDGDIGEPDTATKAALAADDEKWCPTKDVVDAVLYLAQAGDATVEILHMNGSAHAGHC
ncbi:MAG: hypothetical protein WB762_19925 [Candidatus Sulfotelmatobacter sp.]